MELGFAFAWCDVYGLGFAFVLDEVHGLGFAFALDEVHRLGFAFALGEVHGLGFAFALDEVHGLGFAFAWCDVCGLGFAFACGGEGVGSSTPQCTLDSASLHLAHGHSPYEKSQSISCFCASTTLLLVCLFSHCSLLTCTLYTHLGEMDTGYFSK